MSNDPNPEVIKNIDGYKRAFRAIVVALMAGDLNTVMKWKRYLEAGTPTDTLELAIQAVLGNREEFLLALTSLRKGGATNMNGDVFTNHADNDPEDAGGAFTGAVCHTSGNAVTFKSPLPGMTMTCECGWHGRPVIENGQHVVPAHRKRS